MRRSVVPSLVFIGLLVLVAFLLIAGYGLPVGIGFTAGLVLGTVAATVSWFWVRAGIAGSRSVSFGGFDDISTDPQANSADMERYARAMNRVAAVEQGQLRRVVAIGQSAMAGRVRVELIALELRDAGGLVAVAVQSSPPNPPAGSFVELTVTDDVGTEYAAASSGGGMSSPGSSRLEVRFAPAPPAAATTLVIRIDEFLEPLLGPSGHPDRLVGPWEFRVPLR